MGIDNVQSAISDAESNAQFNGITNASFICGAAEKVMDSVLKVSSEPYMTTKASLHSDPHKPARVRVGARHATNC